MSMACIQPGTRCIQPLRVSAAMTLRTPGGGAGGHSCVAVGDYDDRGGVGLGGGFDAGGHVGAAAADRGDVAGLVDALDQLGVVVD